MYSVEKYTSETLMLIDSLSIKNHDIALAVNRGLVVNNGLVIPTALTEWKYYMNLAGIKHSTNNTVMVYVSKTGTTQELTLTLLSTNPSLVNELHTKGTLYRDIIATYPDDREYINGMLYPADINTVTTIPDGTIVGYDTTLVNTNESSVIRELNAYIYNFLSRWYLKEYTITDELYYTSMLGVLYSTLPTILMNIRLAKIKTNEVHPFHIYNYFKARLNLSDDLIFMDDKSKIWLYNNVDYLLNNIGKQGTLDSIISNIFTPNGVGVGGFTVHTPDILVNSTDIPNPIIPLYTKNDLTVKRNALNSYYKDHGVYSPVSDIMNNEIVYDNTKDTGIGDSIAVFTANHITSTQNDMLSVEKKTKLLEIETSDIFNLTGVDMMEVVIDNIVYNTFNNSTNFSVEYTDPNTNRTYKLTLKDSVYLLLTMLQKTTGAASAVSSYNYSTVLDSHVTNQALLHNIVDDAENTYLTREIVNYLPLSNSVNNSQVMFNYFSDIQKFYINNSMLMSNLNTPKLSNNLKTMNNVVNLRGSVDISNAGTPVIPSDMLVANGINYVVSTGYDYVRAIDDLILLLTGINIDSYIYVNDRVSRYTSIMDKLTSYTTQVVKNASINKTIDVKHTTMSISKGDSGVISIIDAKEVNVLHTPLSEHTTMTANNYAYTPSSKVIFDVTTTII